VSDTGHHQPRFRSDQARQCYDPQTCDGPGKDRQERQRPAPLRPRGWAAKRTDHDGHERQPAQAARLDEVAAQRADGIAVNAARLDLGTPTPLRWCHQRLSPARCRRISPAWPRSVAGPPAEGDLSNYTTRDYWLSRVGGRRSRPTGNCRVPKIAATSGRHGFQTGKAHRIIIGSAWIRGQSVPVRYTAEQTLALFQVLG